MIPCVYIRVQDQAVNVKPQTIKYTRRHAKVLKNKASRWECCTLRKNYTF